MSCMTFHDPSGSGGRYCPFVSDTRIKHKLGQNIPVHKIEKMLGKAHGLPVHDGQVRLEDFLNAFRRLQQDVLKEMEAGSVIVTPHAETEEEGA